MGVAPLKVHLSRWGLSRPAGVSEGFAVTFKKREVIYGSPNYFPFFER
jgi:hypothetical protein